MSASAIGSFLLNPSGRYPAGQVTHPPVTPAEARDIATYLLMWSKPTEVPAVESPKPQELQEAFKRLGVRDQSSAAAVLLKDKGCTACHPGLGDTRPRDIRIPDHYGAGCPTGQGGVRYSLPRRYGEIEWDLQAYCYVAPRETHPSPFAERQRRL